MSRSERRFFARPSLATAIVLGFLVVGLAAPAAAQPSLAELLRRSPPLVNGDASVQTVEFEGKVWVGDARMEFVWSRADGYFIALADPKSGVPLVVATDDCLMQFVAADGAIEFTPDFRAGFALNSTPEKVTFGFSRTNGPVAIINVDPASFLSDAKEISEWERRPGGVLRLTALSASGKSRMIVDFDPTQAYPLRRFEAESIEDKKTMLLIDDLRVNQPLKRKLKPAPKDAEFPPGMVVARVSGPATETLAANMGLMLKIMNRIGCAAAIDDISLRGDAEKFEKVDWNVAKANRDKFGPALIKLFAREQP